MTDTSTYGPSALATPANIVTVARMVLAVPLLLAIASGAASYPALVAWIVLAATDGVDGYLARRHGTTRSGAFLDPLADKVLVLGAGWALVAADVLWWLPVALVTARELGISVVRSYYARQGIAVPARQSAKVKTVVQEVSIGFGLLPLAEAEFDWVQDATWWVAVALTLYTGLLYLLDGSRNLSSTGDRDDDVVVD